MSEAYWYDEHVLSRTFSERMQDARDAAMLKDRSALLPRIVRTRPKVVNHTTVADAAGILGVSVQRVRLLLAQGRIPGSRRFKGDWRVRLDHDGLPAVTLGKRGPLMGSKGK